MMTQTLIRKQMFEIGFWELVVVGVVTLWVLGPSRLPVLARVFARMLLRAKNSFQQIKNEIQNEIVRSTSSDPKDE